MKFKFSFHLYALNASFILKSQLLKEIKGQPKRILILMWKLNWPIQSKRAGTDF